MLIEPILGYKSTWRILSLLFETPRRPVSRREIFKFTKLGNAPLSNALNRLVKTEIIIQEKKGKKEFYYVNSDNNYTKLIKELWNNEKRDIRQLDYDINIMISEFIRRLLDSVRIKQAILFGSWAKGTSSSGSDIDIALILEKETKNDIEIANITKNMENKFRKEIQVHPFTYASFGEKNKLTDEIKRDGIRVF